MQHQTSSFYKSVRRFDLDLAFRYESYAVLSDSYIL